MAPVDLLLGLGLIHSALPEMAVQVLGLLEAVLALYVVTSLNCAAAVLSMDRLASVAAAPVESLAVAPALARPGLAAPAAGPAVESLVDSVVPVGSVFLHSRLVGPVCYAVEVREGEQEGQGEDWGFWRIDDVFQSAFSGPPCSRTATCSKETCTTPSPFAQHHRRACSFRAPART